MTKLILVRHGQTESNLKHILQGQSDGALTELGQQQAEVLANQMKDMPIDRIFSSDYKRASHTAEAIARSHGITVEEKPILREWNCGKLDGLPAEELYRARAKSNKPLPDFRPKGGETLREVQKRALKFLQDIENNYKNLNIVVCSHGDFLRMLISVIKKISIEEANDIHLDNVSYSLFEYADGHWETVFINHSATE